MEAAEKPPVCVTGANGFIGSWLIRTLLDRGYTTVHAAVLPGSDPSHLFRLPGPGARLVVHEANVLDADAVSRAVEGCAGGGVFHVASPCTLEDPADPQRELIEPAVDGTLNVLAAAKRFGVRRVVLTSSISALVPNLAWPSGKVVDESSWTDLDYCKSRQKWYPISKTLAEKAAWEFAKENGLDVVAINPATCLGELLQPGLNASCAVLAQLLKGSEETHECHWLGAVHVKDVARAQILLFETPDASGRYLCTNGIYQFGDFAERVSTLFPEFPIRRSFLHPKVERLFPKDPRLGCIKSKKVLHKTTRKLKGTSKSKKHKEQQALNEDTIEKTEESESIEDSVLLILAGIKSD